MKSTSIIYRLSYKVLILVAFSTLGAFSTSQAHEPIFGLGPRTIWLHGFGLEGQLEVQRYTRQALYELEYEGLYGVTPNWSVTVSVAQTLNGPASEGFSFGNVGVRTKYRFYRRDVQGGVYQVSAIGGVQLPTSSDEVGAPRTTDAFAGLSADYEGRRWLTFATARYRLNTNHNNIKRGDAFLYDVAIGVRPIKTSYYQPDVVLMAELNGQVFGANKRNGQTIPGTQGGRLFAGFGAWVTYRNWAIKPGVQIPVYSNIGRNNPTPRFVMGVEFHI